MVRSANGSLHPPENPNDFLKIADQLSKVADYDFVPLLNKDSSNMLPDDWTIIARAVYSRMHQGYSGFVIAHGTDTMHYTSSALAFALGDQLDVPVVLTGSQTIPCVMHGDASINLLRAALVACSPLAEVVVSFNHSVYRGCRVIKTDERSFDAFQSPGLGPVGEIGETLDLKPFAKLSSVIKPSGAVVLRADFVDGIAQVCAVPGSHPEYLLSALESGKCNGLIVQSFGAGNLPDTDGYRWAEVIQAATERLIPVVVSSPFAANSTLNSSYQPAVSALKAGAIAVGDMTQAATMVKFSWVLAQLQQKMTDKLLLPDDYLPQVATMLQTNFVGEMV